MPRRCGRGSLLVPTIKIDPGAHHRTRIPKKKGSLVDVPGNTARHSAEILQER